MSAARRRTSETVRITSSSSLGGKHIRRSAILPDARIEVGADRPGLRRGCQTSGTGERRRQRHRQHASRNLEGDEEWGADGTDGALRLIGWRGTRATGHCEHQAGGNRLSFHEGAPPCRFYPSYGAASLQGQGVWPMPRKMFLLMRVLNDTRDQCSAIYRPLICAR